MAEYCVRCKTILELIPYAFRITKDGNKKYYFMCRRCIAEKQRKYYKTKKGKENIQKAILHYYSKDKSKHNARTAVYHAVKSGKILKPDKCVKCKHKKRLDAHHSDYKKPLDIIWLCRQCHADIHKKV